MRCCSGHQGCVSQGVYQGGSKACARVCEVVYQELPRRLEGHIPGGMLGRISEGTKGVWRTVRECVS